MDSRIHYILEGTDRGDGWPKVACGYDNTAMTTRKKKRTTCPACKEMYPSG